LSHYDDVLQELRQKGQILANQYIVELYNILRDEEKLPPQDCRSKIEHDCIDLWSNATIRKYLSPEAKDTKKQKAGKIGGEKKKELQLLAAQNGARINLAENDSNSQNEAESKTFHDELHEKLSAIVPTQEMYDTTKLLTAKDEENEKLKVEIEELKTELEDAVKQGAFCAAESSNGILLLPAIFAMEIHNVVISTGDTVSAFNLEHNGHEITDVLYNVSSKVDDAKEDRAKIGDLK
jgi:hypothetical protein